MVIQQPRVAAAEMCQDILHQYFFWLNGSNGHKNSQNNWQGMKGFEKVRIFRKTWQNIVKSIIGNKLPDYISYSGFFLVSHGHYSDRLYEATWPEGWTKKAFSAGEMGFSFARHGVFCQRCWHLYPHLKYFTDDDKNNL